MSHSLTLLPVDFFQDAAFHFWSHGCESNYYPACLAAAKLELLRPNHSIRAEPPDPLKALPFLQKACNEGNNGEACQDYASLHIKGTDDIIKVNLCLFTPKFVLSIPLSFQKSPGVAFEYSTKACHLGNWAGCFNLSRMYRDGFGTKKDLVRSEYYGKAAEKLKKRGGTNNASERK